MAKKAKAVIPDWKKNPRICFFFTPPKIKKLKARAAKAGVSVSDYVAGLVEADLKGKAA